MYYSKEVLEKAVANPKAQMIYNKGCNLSNREWNRYVSGYVIDDFLAKMSDEDALEFIQYSSCLTFIQAGMFDSSAQYLRTMVIPQLKSESLIEIAEELAVVLHESDDIK